MTGASTEHETASEEITST